MASFARGSLKEVVQQRASKLMKSGAKFITFHHSVAVFVHLLYIEQDKNTMEIRKRCQQDIGGSERA
jgi:uncharacterized membrane protein YgdD (TMEM256/DUF423 family)